MYCYPAMRQVHPIRVLAFGNEGEEAIANIISSSFKNKIVDHVLADPGVQNDIRGKGGYMVDAQNITFPTVTENLNPLRLRRPLVHLPNSISHTSILISSHSFRNLHEIPNLYLPWENYC
jgi:hypothetical protein